MSHEEQLPECKVSFDGIRLALESIQEENREFRSEQRADLREFSAEQRADLKELKKALLGNGESGVVHRHDKRLASLEEWRQQTPQAEPPSTGPRIPAAFRGWPWYGAAIILLLMIVAALLNVPIPGMP